LLIPKASEPVEWDRLRQAVARFALVEFAGDKLAKRRVLEPSLRKQRAFDTAMTQSYALKANRPGLSPPGRGRSCPFLQ
jgi:hypothetical protein